MKKVLLLISIFCATSFLSSAQFTDLYNFSFSAGEEPFGSLIFDGKGKMYNTAYFGGANFDGCIASWNSDGSGYTDLHDFSGTDGSFPNSPLILINGKLYGTASNGGLNDSGCVFSIDTNGANYTDLHDFTGPDGKFPYNSLVYLNGILYGVADGGANDDGCLFAVDTAGNNYRDLYDFTVATGAYPLGLAPFKGKFYGTTLMGGAHLGGIIFSIDTTGANFSDIHDFDTVRGYAPGGPVMYSNGLLFGATDSGGGLGHGTIFSIDTTGARFKIAYNFHGTDGSQPNNAGGALILSGRRLYGTCFTGGAHDSGTVFSIDSSGSGFKNMFDFRGFNGYEPEGSLTLNGYLLYGATALGGTNNVGTIFAFDTNIAVLNSEHPTICKGDSDLLYVSGLNPATYLWSPGGKTSDSIYAKPLLTTTYTVVSMQGFSQYTNTYTVTVSSQPPPTITGTKTKCKGKTDTLTVTGGATYLWNNGSTSNKYYTGPIMADSVIHVTAYNAFGCSDTASFVILVDTNCNMGMNELGIRSYEFEIAPNPNSGIFKLSCHPELVSGSQLNVYNILGEQIYTTTLTQQTTQLNLSNSPNGVYLYRAINKWGNLIGEGKFIIAK